ncbi:MAG: M61 family metallopeptidase [Ignavibacteria bacterium]
MLKYFYLILILISNQVLSKNLIIEYTLSTPNPANHIFTVELEYSGIKENYIDFKLPVWRPGRYVIFDFSSGIIRFNATGPKSENLKWKKIDKSTWRVITKSINSIKISYDVYSNEFSLRTRGLDEEHGFIDGTAVFMYCQKFRSLPLTLTVNPYNDWHVTTGLENVPGDNFKFSAPDYDYFSDCPIEIGTQEDIEFEVEGKKHVISISGKPSFSKDTLINDLSTIIKKEYEFWNTVPYSKYVFFIHCNQEGGGGTEHINSSVNDITPRVFKNEKSYKGFLRLISHEFFHTWNVKQLRPKGLTPYDFEKENYTEELWIAEGSTSYYDGLIVLRCGMDSVSNFLNDLCDEIDDERNTPGNNFQSLAESSYDAWVKFWKNSYAVKNEFETSYYGKGADVSLLLDLEIRQRTRNKYSLDDVFRRMYSEHPLGNGYTNSDFMNTCNDISGTDFKQYFVDFVYGVKPLDWEIELSYAGLELIKNDTASKPPVLGITLSSSDGRVFISGVEGNSSAEDAGFQGGDEIIAVDKSKLSYNEIKMKLDSIKSGDALKFTIFRVNQMMDLTLYLENKKLTGYSIKKTESPAALQKSIYESWLGNKW